MEAANVPMPFANLLVPYAICIGIPAKIYAGKDIIPPPPATASTKPAQNTNGHMISNVILYEYITSPNDNKLIIFSIKIINLLRL